MSTVTQSRLQGAIHYADSRAQSTGYRYMVSDMGHALIDCPNNRQVLKNIGCEIVYIARPTV